jgi:hypothetical protein
MLRCLVMSMAGREQIREMGKKKRNNLNPKYGLKHH